MSNMTANFTLLFKDSFSNKLRASLSTAQKGFGKLKNTIANFSNGSEFLQTAANLSLVSGHLRGMTQSFGAVSDKTSAVAADFESSMASVKSSLAMSVGAGKEMQTQYNMIANASRDWSKTHSDSASDYANTSYQMLSAGLGATEAIEGTNAALLLAKATMGSATESGNLLATVYNNMKIEGENANQAMSRMSDVIAKTQGMFQLSNLNQLGEGLKYAVAAAKPAGMQLEQVSTIIGALNTAGLQGSQAGTAFAATLRGIDKAGKKLGFEVVYDDEGLNFIQTLENINKKFGSIEQRTVAQRQALQKTFGDEGVRAINLLGGSLESLKTSYDAINKAQGTTATMASAMADTYKDKMQGSLNTLNLFNEQLGKGANAVRLWGMNVLAGTASLFTFNNESEKGKEKLMSFLGGTVQVTSSLGSLVSGGLSATTGLASFFFMNEKFPILKKGAGFIKTTTKGFFGLGKSVLKAIPTMGTWIATVWSAAAAHIAAFWPIYAIIGGVALLGAGIVLLVKHWDAVKTAITGGVITAFEALKTAVFWVWDGFKKLMSNPLIAAAGVLFAPFIAIPALIIKHWEPIKNFFGLLFGTVGKVIDKVGAFLGFGNSPKFAVDGARALGGPVLAGGSYLVGEHGPEIFTPSKSGQIIPNHALSSRGATDTAGMSPRNVAIHIDQVLLPKPDDMSDFVRLVKEFSAEVQGA